MTAKYKNHNHRTKYNISNDVEKLKAALFHTTNDLKGRAGEMVNESMGSLKEQSFVVQDNVADYTARRPFKALGIALLSGIVLGILINRK